jgi:hypothetical protein
MGIGCNDVKWIHLAQDSIQWRALVNKVTYFENTLKVLTSQPASVSQNTGLTTLLREISVAILEINLFSHVLKPHWPLLLLLCYADSPNSVRVSDLTTVPIKN